MKNLKFKWLKKQFYLFFIPALLFTACDEEGVRSNYVGTWTALVSISNDDITADFRFVRTFTEYSFTALSQYSVNDSWVDFTKLKGSFTVTENIMNFNITEIGISGINSQTGDPDGIIIMYKNDIPEFKSILSMAGTMATYKSAFSIFENKMSVMNDNNMDGDYADDNETMIYVKQ